MNMQESEFGLWLNLTTVIICLETPRVQERPYHDDSTASRLLSEVKHRRVGLVLRWGTTYSDNKFDSATVGIDHV